MRKTGSFVWLGALVFGLVLVTGVTAAPGARAADQPWLGIYMQDLTSDLREGMEYKGSGGVLVSSVVPNGPADRAGVEKGDVILRVNSRLVSSPSELQDVVQSARVGQTVALQVYRDGEERTLSVTLRVRPAGQEMESPEGTMEAPDVLAPDREVRELNIPDMRMFSMLDRGRLGIRIESLNPDLGDYFGLREGRGVLVLGVYDNTPAERAGLKSGDVITRVDDRPVTNAEDLIEALRGKEGNVTLRIVRHGTPRTIQATLERTQYNTPRGSMRMMTPAPGARQQLRMQQNRDDMQRQIDELKKQVEELQQKLEQKGGGGD